MNLVCPYCGKDDAELGRLMRQYATQKAYRVARAAQ